MKKKIILYILGCLLLFIIACSVLFNFNNKDSNLKKITVAEVAHTVFYAPQYVALELGYFEEVGLDVELILANGADKVTAAVLSGDADIGFSGSEATIYVYNGGEKDYLKTFAQLTQRDGSFLVSREKIDNFTLDDLKGKTIIAGRAYGMPEMTLKYSLKQNGINPDTELTLDTSVAFAAMSGTFIGGVGDFVSLFDVNATKKDDYSSFFFSWIFCKKFKLKSKPSDILSCISCLTASAIFHSSGNVSLVFSNS
ncbi:MAG: ABC transporter substrate-binding protein [Bacilli bacterium]|nr:ABC transporter substrate-binding protein [Bacilli bacterium]